MNKAVFSVDAQKKMKVCCSDYPLNQFRVGVIHLTEGTAGISASAMKDLPRAECSGGAFCEHEEALSINGLHNFGVAPSRFPYQTGKGQTYEAVLREYLMQEAMKASTGEENGPMLFAICVPEHPEWRDHLADFRSWMDECFVAYPGWIPMVLTESMVLEAMKQPADNCLFVSLDRRWTSFFSIKKSIVRKKFFCGIGMESEVREGEIRVNAVTGPGEMWGSMKCDSWLEGLLHILKDISTVQLRGVSCIRILGPEEISRQVVQEILSDPNHAADVGVTEHFCWEISQFAAASLTAAADSIRAQKISSQPEVKSNPDKPEPHPAVQDDKTKMPKAVDDIFRL